MFIMKLLLTVIFLGAALYGVIHIVKHSDDAKNEPPDESDNHFVN